MFGTQAQESNHTEKIHKILFFFTTLQNQYFTTLTHETHKT